MSEAMEINLDCLPVILANHAAAMRDLELAMCEANFDSECRYVMASRLCREFASWGIRSFE